MDIRDLIFEPHSDMEIDDVQIVSEHTNLIKQGNASKAQEYLKSKAYKKGVLAELFNKLEEKIKEFQVSILNKHAAPDELYSYADPTAEEMQGKLFWIKPIDD